MSNAFDPIQLRWQDRDFTIPANRVMMAIAIVEDVLPLHRIASMAASGDINLTRVSMAYGAVLRFAGGEVTDEEIFKSLISSPDQSMIAASSLQTLLMMMVPRELREGGSQKAQPGKGSRKRGSSSSSKRTKRQSEKVA